VLEDSNQSLTKAEYEALVSGKSEPDTSTTEDDAKTTSHTTNPEAKAEMKPSKDNIAEVGKASKKRKAVKVIGDPEDEVKMDAARSNSKPAKKAKKKVKPVKLSFGDQEEG
jgi:hypothetical protein